MGQPRDLGNLGRPAFVVHSRFISSISIASFTHPIYSDTERRLASLP